MVTPASLNMPSSQYAQNCYFYTTAAGVAQANSGTFTLIAASPTVIIPYPSGGAWQVGDVMSVVIAPVTGWNAAQCATVNVDFMKVGGCVVELPALGFTSCQSLYVSDIPALYATVGKP